MEWWHESRALILKARRKCFDSLALVTIWMLWKEQNGRVFLCSAAVARKLCRHIGGEIELWKLFGAKGFSDIFTIKGVSSVVMVGQ